MYWSVLVPHGLISFRIRCCLPHQLRATFAMKRSAASTTDSNLPSKTTTTQKASSNKRVRSVRSKQRRSKQQAADTAAAGLGLGETVQQASAAAVATGVALDDLPRCKWAGMYRGAAAADYVRYHDEEWGRPLHDDKQLFELLCLEGAQAGLSWSTVLARREGYRKAFEGFDPVKVASFDAAHVEALLAEGSGVVRHKGKLFSVVQNAKVVLQLQREHGSLDAFLWSFVPNSQPIINTWTAMDQVPTKTAEAEAMSKALKAAGMSFVGPTICYAFMQAAGLVNDHTVDCHCYKEVTNSYSDCSC